MIRLEHAVREVLRLWESGAIQPARTFEVAEAMNELRRSLELELEAEKKKAQAEMVRPYLTTTR